MPKAAARVSPGPPRRNAEPNTMLRGPIEAVRRVVVAVNEADDALLLCADLRDRPGSQEAIARALAAHMLRLADDLRDKAQAIVWAAGSPL